MIRVIIFPSLWLSVGLAPGLALCVLSKIAWERPCVGPLSNGKFPLPTSTKHAHVIAIPAKDRDSQDDDNF